MSAGDLALLLLVAGGTGAVMLRKILRGDTWTLQQRDLALAQFRATKLSIPGHMDFDGSQAQILEFREFKYSGYALTVLARMPDGIEYEFKSDPSGKPWLICRSRGDSNGVRAHAPYQLSQ